MTRTQEAALRELQRRYQAELIRLQANSHLATATTDWPLVETDPIAWQNWAAAGLPGLPMRSQQAD